MRIRSINNNKPVNTNMGQSKPFYKIADVNIFLFVGGRWYCKTITRRQLKDGLSTCSATDPFTFSGVSFQDE